MRKGLTGKLQTRMTVLFGVLLLIGCLLLTYLSVNRAGTALEGEAEQAMLKLIRQAAETVDSRVQARLYIVESLANRISLGNSLAGDGGTSLEEQLQNLRYEQNMAESLGFKQFGIADREGGAVFTDGQTANVADRDYFRTALEGKAAVSSTTVSSVDKSVVFTYAVPIHRYASDEVAGVLIGVVDAARFNELVGNITYCRTGYAFAVDGTGKVIAHKDLNKVLSQENILKQAVSDKEQGSLATVVSRMVKGKEGIATYSYKGKQNIIAYAPVKSTGWSLAVTAPRAEVLEQMAGLTHSMLVLSAVIILVILSLIYVLAWSVANPLVRAVNLLDKISDGDFTGRVPEWFLRRRDEVGMLTRAVDRLQSNIRPLLTGLRESAKTLAGNSENLGAASEEIASSSNEVARAIQQVAAGTSEQAGHLQEILGLLDKMTANMKKVEEALGNVTSSSEETSRLAGVGKQELDTLVASINGVQEAFKAVAEKLNGLSGSVNQAGEILEVINGIADQTNLLALNAAIEAARAGEAGRGFAVVAEEVRKLAEQSRTSSDRIKALLETIASETVEVVNTSEEVDRQVAAQLQGVANTLKAFDNILNSVAAIRPAIEGTNRHMNETVRARDVVLERVRSVEAVAEEVSASAQQISASAEELSASTEEIAASAQEIMGVAKNLEEQVGRFRL